MDDEPFHVHSVSDSRSSGAGPGDSGMETSLHRGRDSHPGEAYEALPDDAVRPTEVTIRPRYADDTTTAWVSAGIEDVVSLPDSR